MITLMQEETDHEDYPWRVFSYGDYVFVTGFGYDEPYGSITVFKLVNGLLSFLYVHPLAYANDVWFDGTYVAVSHYFGFNVYTFTEEALTLVDSYELASPDKMIKIGDVWHIACYDLGLCAFTLVDNEIVLLDNEPVLEADFKYAGIDGYEIDASNHMLVTCNSLYSGDDRKVLAYTFNISTGYSLVATCIPTGLYSTTSIALVRNDISGIHQLWGSVGSHGVDVYEFNTGTSTITYKTNIDNGGSYTVFAAGDYCFDANSAGLFICSFDGVDASVVDSYLTAGDTYVVWSDSKKAFLCCDASVLNFVMNEITSTKEVFTLGMKLGF